MIMGHVNTLFRKAIVPLAVIAAVMYGVTAYGRGNPLSGVAVKRADIITIDTLRHFGKLERPPVVFLHDAHTRALQKNRQDCSVCHLPEKGRLSVKFERLKDDSKKGVMDIYHSQCIGCHQKRAAAGEKSGPVTCGDCHRKKPGVVSTRRPMGMDKSLHFRHTRAEDNKCELCHHAYDEKTQKLFYAKGKEDSCRYCHGKITEQNRISDQLASHIACITCHRNTVAAGKKAGPIECSGCHDPERQAQIEKIADVPRIKRDQPDAVLIKISKDAAPPEGRMNFTPFDHKAHETYTDTCRVCHHASLDACNKCHTLTGTKAGKGITLDTAMHQADASESCVGCHNLQKRDVKCAGCHRTMNRIPKDENSCQKCHMKPLSPSVASPCPAMPAAAPSPESVPAPAVSPSPASMPAASPMPAAPSLPAAGAMPPSMPMASPATGIAPSPTSPSDPASRDAAEAKALLDSRTLVASTFPEPVLKDIPEKVTIKLLANQYEPVTFPHRKIVQALLKNVAGSKLAAYFHPDQMTVCQGCHHNSPESLKPPKCQNCHGKPFNERNPQMPGLKGAYHQQCMGCHKAMKMEKPMGCTDCHAEKKQ